MHEYANRFFASRCRLHLCMKSAFGECKQDRRRLV
jgi:hypothetical protein